MPVEVPHDDVIFDVAGGRREVAALPEALSPMSLVDVFELLLGFARGSRLAQQTKSLTAMCGGISTSIRT